MYIRILSQGTSLAAHQISAGGKTLIIKRLKIAEGYTIFQWKQSEILQSILEFNPLFL